MFYQLPPVGNRVCLHAKKRDETSLKTMFPPYQVKYYASGTAALAAALIATMKVKNIQSAEVILPAYGCPDLISAIEFAGAKPILVDFEMDRPWLDLAQIELAITEKTVAIIAVNLFGISERWDLLRKLADKKDLTLIEDSAQYFPGMDEWHEWHGDLVVLSFGRGKPVSLLGGGAVLAKQSPLFEQLPRFENIANSLAERFSYRLKATLYNAVISPFLYWLPQSLPFLHLGETRYHALADIEMIDQVCLDLLPCNIARYQDDVHVVLCAEKISIMLDTVGDESGDAIINLPQACGTEVNHRLLRYPVLLTASTRDQVFHKLSRAGLGASIMYPASLPKINGLEHILGDKQNFPNAELFASRLITLPMHSFVSEKNIKKMKALLVEYI